MSENKHITVIFVHGAWQTRDTFSAVLPMLQAQGFVCHAIDLPGHGNNMQPFSKITLRCYVDCVCDVIENLPKPTDVVLVGHSMAGMVISEVAERIRVKQLIYLAGFLPASGQSLLDIAEKFTHTGLQPHMQFDLKENKITLNKSGLKNILYNDCDDGLANAAVQRLQPQPVLPFNGRVCLGLQFDLTEKTYCLCLRDNVIIPRAQRNMCCDQNINIVEFDAGHAPMISNPKRLVRLLTEALRGNIKRAVKLG